MTNSLFEPFFRGVKGNVRMFVDDTKLWTCIRSEPDSVSLQNVLDRLVEWSNECQLGFNHKSVK